MAAVTVRALKAFTYQGRTIAVGEAVTFENPAEALAKGRAGDVSLDRHYNTRALVPENPQEPEPEPSPRRRRGRPRKIDTDDSRTYNRRDMKAED